MKDHTDINAKSKAVRQQLEAKLGVKGRSLEHALNRAGRRLPRRARARGKVLVAAERLAGHPKLSRQVDPAALKDAYDELSAHLGQIDVADRRKGKFLSLAGAIAANLLIVVAGFVVWLWWRGYV